MIAPSPMEHSPRLSAALTIVSGLPLVKYSPALCAALINPGASSPAVWAGSGAGRDGFLRHVGHPLCSINDAGGQSVTGKIKKAPGGVNGRGLNLGTLGW